MEALPSRSDLILITCQILYLLIFHTGLGFLHINLGGYKAPGDSVLKNQPAMQETQAQSLGQDDPLEKKMATHSRILAWRIPWTEEPGGPQSMGL